MAKMVTQDFMIPDRTLTMGQFLVDCYTIYPEGSVQSAAYQHSMKLGYSALEFTCPEDGAVILKLKYGDYIVTRRPAEDFSGMLKSIRKKSYIEDEWLYPKIMKNKNITFDDTIEEKADTDYVKKFYDMYLTKERNQKDLGTNPLTYIKNKIR